MGRCLQPAQRAADQRWTERARSVLATMLSVQTRHIIARGRLYVNSLFADVSSPFLPTYWLGNYRMAKYDYEVSGRAGSGAHDRVLSLASAAFPRSIIFPGFSAITTKQVLAAGVPVDRNPRDNPEKKRAGRKSRPAHQRIDSGLSTGVDLRSVPLVSGDVSSCCNPHNKPDDRMRA